MDLLEDVLAQFLKGATTLSPLQPTNDQGLFDLITRLGIKSQNLLVVLEELLINSQEHGDGHPQLYYGRIDQFFTFLIVDQGVGIHDTLPMNPRLSDTKGKSSSSIIRLSLEEGITGTGQAGRGMGLYYLSQLVRQHDAEALVASDQGCVIQQAAVFHEKELANDIKSTVVVLRINAKAVGA